MCKTIKHKVKFKASPETIYEYIADSKKMTSLTGEKAVIGQKVGSPFSILKGKVNGVIVDILPSRRIVQAWRRLDFPEGIFSMASFTLRETADGGTELILTHRGVPKELIPEVEHDWKRNFWDKIHKEIQSKKSIHRS
ncbi:SRPBCC domain-containing protein [Leptospira levettii]|uniref:SRPBCC domain-containing protein n=1 Tax=Leptospira levettii TaxID=2023178 RepID=UPI001083BAA6|nr:SRPBCC domain-containing protein [Leptospira levettii]MCG6146938.1 SRPBCC domain-containing protein [Leptospira levettii]MCW7507017.1 SRPBCC domain-containing protein [Leptospira levettii]MCW7518107.1 SRPBCC domain-containing protein [Leptospira levettii]TGK99494.1 hypothetical protein EHQ34_14890 [Leptospira levettii]